MKHTHGGTNGLFLHSASYDFFLWLLSLGREKALRNKVLRLADLAPGESVLDVGCGTGTLAIGVKQRLGPDGAVYAIDASPQMLARARAKAKRRSVSVSFEHAAAEALPFPDTSFDVVFNTIMLHHLPRQARLECLSETRRVLKPGGRFVVVDFDRHRHGEVKMEELIATLKEAGFSIDQSGRFDKHGLYFVRVSRAASDEI